MKRLRYVPLMLIGVLCCAGCSSGTGKSVAGQGDTLTHEATLLSIVGTPDQGHIVEIVNPWNTSELLARYQILERGVEAAPVDGAEIIYVPVERSLVYSGVHAGVVDELGEAWRITAVADAPYFTVESIKRRLEAGEVADCGFSMAPDLERVAAASPEIIVASPYNNAGYGPIEHLPAVIVQMADYMEPTPAARAEWVKLLGLLYGCYESADSLYRSAAGEYDRLASMTQKLNSRPVVITETPGTDGIWALPGGGSYMARMLMDAGADYPWAETTEAGSLQMDFAKVLDRARGADVWLIRSFGAIRTLDDLRDEYPLNSRFKAFENGNVWVCDTKSVPLFDIFPFHPDVLLREYINIFHPSLLGDSVTKFYRRVY